MLGFYSQEGVHLLLGSILRLMDCQRLGIEQKARITLCLPSKGLVESGVKLAATH